LEQGQRRPRIDTLIELACSLEVPVDELLDGIDWVPRTNGRGSFRIAAPKAE
jgi:transcriptional regulator with XRE-family HTH domain